MDSTNKKESAQRKQTQEQRKTGPNNGQHPSRRKPSHKQAHSSRGKNNPETTIKSDTLDKTIEEVVEPKKESIVKRIDHSTITIDGDRYEIIKDYREAFDADQLNERYSPILEKYDYIVADWGYEQLRLKGFYANNNRKVAPDKKISQLEDYLFEYCNFGAPYFVLERLDPKKKQQPQAAESENPRKKRKRKSRPTKRSGQVPENTDRSVPKSGTENRTPSQNKKRPFVQKEVTPKIKEKPKETVVVKTVKDEKGSRRFNIRRNDVNRVKNKS